MVRTRERSTVADDDLNIHRGSGDFLADQGIEDTEEFRVKAHLCQEIAIILESRNLTQAQAAAITEQKQSDLSRIVNGRFADYSVWRLLKVLSALGPDVLIAINPTGQSARGTITSQTLADQDEPSEL